MATQAVHHFVLTFAWLVLTDEYTLQNGAVGYVIGGLILTFYAYRRGERLYVGRVYWAVKLLLVLLWEQLKSGIQVAALVLSPKMRIAPGIIALPLQVTSDAEITTVANLLTLTPGGVSIHVSQDRTLLYLHVIDVGDGDGPPADLMATKERFEYLIMKVTRG